MDCFFDLNVVRSVAGCHLINHSPFVMSYDSFRETFTSKNILLFGFGLLGGGKGSLSVFQTLECQIVITDAKSESQLADTLNTIQTKNLVHTTFGKHSYEDIDWADVIVKNPAVPDTNPFISYAKKKQKRVTTDAALFLQFSQSKTVGITGTRGKTTTTLLTHHLLKNSLSLPVQLGGNIQNIGSLPLLLTETPTTITVLELSSFALTGCHQERVSPQIAVITNLYPDHMNYHASMEEYAHEKSAIFAYQKSSDHVFLNQTNEWTPFFSTKVHSQLHLISPTLFPLAKQMPLPGEHNQWNAAFAIAISTMLGVKQDSISQHLHTFQGAEFRQQVLKTVNGTQFINDSTSTTPEALTAALSTFPDADFIIGGTSKKLPLEHLATKLQQHRGNLYALKGSGTTELLGQLDKQVRVFESLKQAFVAAIENHPKQVVFSPGFTSFELFRNEFDRANQFSELVNQV